MKTRLARAGALLATALCICMVPLRAPAQLLPPLPGGQLIVTVTSPASGSTVSGTIPVNASVSIVGSLTVSRVDFFVHGNFIGSDSTAGYSVSWNTRNVGNGSHSLTAVARDILGVPWTSNAVTVNVSNGPPPDTTPPAVSITAPANGATVSGAITVTASASDNIGVVGVRFFLDGALAADDTSAPYAVPWDTTGASHGSHTLTAIARDAAGNTGTSAPITVTVANNGGAPTRFEENSPAVTAGPAEAWVLRGAEVATFSGGVAGSSDTAGSTVTFTFNGTAVSWIGLRCGICGIASVSIDGGAPAVVDTAGPAAPGSPGLASSAVFTASGLASGSHTMVITVTGNTSSGGAHIVVDAFDVAGGSSGSTASRIEANDPAVTANPLGAWVPRGAEIAAFSAGSAGSSDVSGATATLVFQGTGVSWIGLRCNVCGVATVVIDGGPANAVDTGGLASPGTPGLASESVFAAFGLAPGTHTLVITVTGTTTTGGAHVIVDAFDVTP
jgi:hypothetical protein